MLVTIIVNYKSNFRTIEFVKEELCKVSLEQKIVIVNNGATPESDEELVKALGAHIVTSEHGFGNHANVYLISNPNNSGFAKGNNIGARFAIDVLDPSVGKKLISSLFLMAFVIMDEGTGTISILYDGDDTFQTYALETLERDNSMNSNKLGREIGRMISH